MRRSHGRWGLGGRRSAVMVVAVSSIGVDQSLTDGEEVFPKLGR
jgi:hypothetical protein